MLDLEASGGLHHVECADHVAVEIGARIFKAVADAGLCREVDDNLWLEVICKVVKFDLILQHALGHRKIGVLKQHLMATLFQCHIIVISHAVIAVNAKALSEKQFSQVEADEPSGACDEPTFPKWHAV